MWKKGENHNTVQIIIFKKCLFRGSVAVLLANFEFYTSHIISLTIPYFLNFLLEIEN